MGRGGRKSILGGEQSMQDPRVSEGLGMFKDQETDKKEEAGQVMLGSQATERSLHFSQRVMRRY